MTARVSRSPTLSARHVGPCVSALTDYPAAVTGRSRGGEVIWVTTVSSGVNATMTLRGHSHRALSDGSN